MPEELPKECYEIYYGEEQEPKTLSEVLKVNKLLQLLNDKQMSYGWSFDDETEVVSIGKTEVVSDDKNFRVFKYPQEQLVLTTTDIDVVINYLFGE